MNVVILNDNAYVTGGGGKIALSTAKGLAQRGHRVFVMTAVGPVAAELEGVDGLEVLCTGQYEILTDKNRLRAVVQGYWNRTAAKEMRRLLARLDPAGTVVHLHTWGKALSSSVVRTAIDQGFQTVCTLHDYAIACPIGSLFNHPRQQICRLSPMSASCILSNCDTRNYGHKLWRVGRELVQINAGRLPTGIRHFIALSQLSHDVLKPWLPSGAAVHFVSNFTEAAADVEVDVASNRSFVFAGRLVREKGPHLFAECARRLNLDAVFVGDGEFRAQVASIYPGAVITGWIQPHEAIEHLTRARALVFPSLWYEVQPLVILEAAAMGIPAIVPDTSAAREMIADGETGLLFEGGNVESLVQKVQALSDGALAARMGQAAYRRFWSNPPTLSKHVDQLESVYRLMLGQPASSKPRRALANARGSVVSIRTVTVRERS